MFNLIPNLFTKHLWDWLRPTALLEGIHASLKLCASSMQSAECVANIEYNDEPTGSLYAVCSVPVSNIKTSAAIAGEPKAATMVAGRITDTAFPYFVTGLPSNIVALGKSPDSELLLKYTDFVPCGCGYKFRKDPAEFGTYSDQAGAGEVSFYCIGGDRRVRHQPQFGETFGNTSNPIVTKAVKHSIGTAEVRAGVDNYSVYAAAGVSISNNTSAETISWIEGGTRYYVSPDGELLSARAELAYTDSITKGYPVTHDTGGAVVFPLNNRWYWMSPQLEGMNSAWDALGLFDHYPNIDRRSTELCRQLRAICEYNHSITITVDSGTLTGMDHAVLSKYIPATGSIHLVSSVAAEIEAYPETAISKDTVDTVYILYTTTASAGRQEPGVLPKTLLDVVDGTLGCCRIQGGFRSPAVIADISSNGTIYGAPLSPSAKIYGLCAVRGGKTYMEDVIYGYCSTSPTTVGAGNEVIALIHLR